MGAFVIRTNGTSVFWLALTSDFPSFFSLFLHVSIIISSASPVDISISSVSFSAFVDFGGVEEANIKQQFRFRLGHDVLWMGSSGFRGLFA